MSDDDAAYLSQLEPEQARELARMQPPRAERCAIPRRREAVAFLGAGASAPLYPLWRA
jgi:hypothetical protein